MSKKKPADAEPQAPAIHDSDLIYLAIKRLEAIAMKMQRLEYDDELETLMERATEMFGWAAWNMTHRNTRNESGKS